MKPPKPRNNTPPPAAETAALQQLMGLFGAVKQAFREELTGGAEASGSPVALRLLLLCQRQPGLTQQALVQATGRDKGQVARLVKELLDQGLLLREPHPEDKRSHCLRPSAAGLQACRRFEQAEAAVAARLFGDLPAATLQAMRDELQRLQARLRG
ncbi:MarR family winged helix-turn-helix transcriptional regulator [Rubrivivax rivuli]|nr:MarR family transcriptional regulator [Rubrivivax rivuli]